MGTIAGTAQQYAVVADQKLDQVWLYYRTPGTNRFGSPVPIDSSRQLPLLAPGAVQTFTVPANPNPYMVVANSLSNDILLYQYDSGPGQFALTTSYSVGDNPVSVTVNDINGDGVPDLAVVNQGSNDVSILMGNADPVTHHWTATAYQRVSSGGYGPVGVSFVQQPGSNHGPDLLATNSDGTLVLVPGVGTGDRGSGFFAGSNATVSHVPAEPVGLLNGGLLPTTAGIFQVDPATLTATLVFAAPDLTALGVGAAGQVVAGLRDGSLELLTTNGAGGFTASLLFRNAQPDQPQRC